MKLNTWRMLIKDNHPVKRAQLALHQTALNGETQRRYFRNVSVVLSLQWKPMGTNIVRLPTLIFEDIQKHLSEYVSCRSNKQIVYHIISFILYTTILYIINIL